MSGFRIPWRASSRAVMRVSSAAIAPTSPRIRTARAVVSSRLPMGVPTTQRGFPRPSRLAGCLLHAPSPPLPGGQGGCLDIKPFPYLGGDFVRRADEARGRRQDVEEGPALTPAA